MFFFRISTIRKIKFLPATGHPVTRCCLTLFNICFWFDLTRSVVLTFDNQKQKVQIIWNHHQNLLINRNQFSKATLGIKHKPKNVLLWGCYTQPNRLRECCDWFLLPTCAPILDAGIRSLETSTNKRCLQYGLRSFPSIALRIPYCAQSHVISVRALENGGFFFSAGPRHRSKSSFLRKRVWWPIILFCCFELNNK